MVPAAVTGKTVDDLADRLESGRHHHRRRQLLLPRRHRPRRGPFRAKGLHYVDVGHQRRGVGARARLLPHGGWRCRGRQTGWSRSSSRSHRASAPSTATPGVGRPEPRRAGLAPLRAQPRRPLREVVHNGIEDARHDLPTPRASTSSTAPTSALTRWEDDAETAPLRDPKYYQFDLNLADVAEVWRRGSVITSWLFNLTAEALVADPQPRAVPGPESRTRARVAGRASPPSRKACRRHC